MNIIKVFTDYRQFQIFILGIFSGMPLAIIYTTLSGWMSVLKVDIAIVTAVAFTRWFYSLKFIWAPFVDSFKIPILHKIGQRKSWMCFASSIIAVIIFLYGKCSPEISIIPLYLLTVVLAFVSATLDIVIDAFRIDMIERDKQSIASANAVLGYLFGGMISGAGAFLFAEDYGWEMVFTFLASLYILGILFMLTLREPKVARDRLSKVTLHSWKKITIDPFRDFLKRDGAIVVLLAVIFYKLGDAMLGVVSSPFYVDLGFSLKEIGSVVKLIGFIPMVAGSYIGGYIMYRFGHFKGLMIGGIAQSITNLSFVWLNHMGYDVNALMIAISIENIASGMGNAALVGYLSYLCNKQFSATQYALLSSASGLFSHSIVGFGGVIAKNLGWDLYFIMTIVLAIPGLVLLVCVNKKYGFSSKAT
ncbi:MFS transporter [Rickettsiaceae bacterium]|nr:MFS transporter [Rickettsiaceae bacterium]